MPDPKGEANKVTTSTQPCGTIAGYERHRRRHEPPCDDCRDAKGAYMKAWRRGEVPDRVPAQCGTPYGHRRHRRRGEEPCQPCRDAYNATKRHYARTGEWRLPDNWAPEDDR